MTSFDMSRDRYVSVVFGLTKRRSPISRLRITSRRRIAEIPASGRRGEGSPHDRPAVADGRRPTEGAIVVGVPDDISMQVLTEDECLALLSSQEVGRIAFAFEDRIEIFPINYRLEGAVLVFPTG